MQASTEHLLHEPDHPYDRNLVEQNNSKENKLKKFFEQNGYLSFIFIMLRKLVQMGQSVAEVVIGPFNNIPAGVLNVIKYIQLPLYGLYTLIGTIGSAIRIFNIWSEKGPYANKAPKALWKKIKTTIFTGGMQLSDLSVFAFTIAVTLGAATLASPVGYVLLGINATINTVKYGWSLIREIVNTAERRLSPNYKPKIGAMNGYRMADKSAKLGMALMMAAGIVVVALFASNPYGLAIAAGIMVAWSAARLIHFFVKRHYLSNKIKERDIELGLVKNEVVDTNTVSENPKNSKGMSHKATTDALKSPPESTPIPVPANKHGVRVMPDQKDDTFTPLSSSPLSLYNSASPRSGLIESTPANSAELQKANGLKPKTH